MELEAKEIDRDGEDDKSEDSSDPVTRVGSLSMERERGGKVGDGNKTNKDRFFVSFNQNLFRCEISKSPRNEQPLRLALTRTKGIERSPNLSQRSSTVYNPTRAVAKSPTHLTLKEGERRKEATTSREMGQFREDGD